MESFINVRNFTMEMLLGLHIRARGGEIVSKEEAEHFFEAKEFKNNYQKIISYM